MTENGTVSTYTYRGNGLRDSKTVNGETIRQVWDGNNLITETDSNYQVKARYYRGNSLIAQEQEGYLTYYQFNGHGDVTGLTDTNGRKVQDYQYDAFGNQIEEEEIPNPFQYAGEYYDEESGLTYLRNRYYDSSAGRFITEDPAQDGMNWYAYASNNPVMFVDPLGLFDYYTRLSSSQEYNEDVVALQNELVWLGYMDRPADDDWGYFGPATLAAVNAYKQDMGLWNDGANYGVVGLTTWQSLGLIYRTQGDIDRGLDITLVGHAQYFDVTRMFNDQLWYAEQYLLEQGIFRSAEAWYNKVNHYGDWDIKRRESWDRTFGGSYPGSYDTLVVLYGKLTTPEKMGNIMYGYTGKIVGWSDTILYAGSFGAASPKNWGEVSAELSDWESIAEGINLYYDKHGWIPPIFA